jgi:hypothetical protein
MNGHVRAANVFGKPKTNTEYTAYSGEGFQLLIPSKWNPSREREYPGQVLRYEDNFDATSNVSVMITPTDKKTIADYGSPEEFLGKVSYYYYFRKKVIIIRVINYHAFCSLIFFETQYMHTYTRTSNHSYEYTHIIPYEHHRKIFKFTKSVIKSTSLSTEISPPTKKIISHKYNTHIKSII